MWYLYVCVMGWLCVLCIGYTCVHVVVRGMCVECVHVEYVCAGVHEVRSTTTEALGKPYRPPFPQRTPDCKQL